MKKLDLKDLKKIKGGYDAWPSAYYMPNLT